MTSPAGLAVGIAGQQVNIKTFASTASDPFYFTFTIDASLIPAGQSATTLDVYKDGNLVADCSGLGATISPRGLRRGPVGRKPRLFTALA